MKHILSFILLFIVAKTFAQSSPNDLVIGKIDSVYSNILQEERKIWVSVPDSNTAYYKRNPVLYLLDAESHFYSTVAIIRQLRDVLPDLIVIGIPNTDRTRDLTPTHVDADPENHMDSNFVRTSGGAEMFTQFIEKELIPHVDSVYPTAPYRILSGHSFGGLFVVNTFVNHNKLFNAYLALDPSLWWDNQLLFKQAKQFINQQQLNHQSLFLGFTNSLGFADPGFKYKALDTARVKKDTTASTLMLRTNFLFRDALQHNHSNGLRWNYKYYPDEVHGSVELIAEYDALHFLFDYYIFMDYNKMYDTANDGAQLYANLFKEISKNFGYTVYPNESFIGYIAYDMLKKKNYKTALGFFKMWVDDYPQDANAYDSMGDYYVEVGNKQKAAEYFKKALAIKENADTRKKLEGLLGKK